MINKKNIKETVEYIFRQKTKASTDRVIKASTGRVGAINFLNIQSGETMSKESENKMLDGQYKVTDYGIEYLGLWDDNIKDGGYLKHNKERDTYCIETWKDGFRNNHKFITKEEFYEYTVQFDAKLL